MTAECRVCVEHFTVNSASQKKKVPAVMEPDGSLPFSLTPAIYAILS
jgi:hypothetical protein